MSNTFQWTPDQELIFSSLLEAPRESFIVDACAGSSKTTTMVESVQRLVSSGVPAPTICALAFNKSIATTLAERMPPGVECSTMNAMGHRALRSIIPVRGRLNVSGWKEANLWQNIPAYDSLDRPAQRAIHEAYAALKIGGLVPAELDFDLLPTAEATTVADLRVHHSRLKSLAPHISVRDAFSDNITDRSLDLDPADFIEYLPAIFTLDLYASFHQGRISFLDQLYLSALHSAARLPTYHHVIVDEAQDLGSLEHAILRKLVSRFPAGRLIAVGDQAQAIYAFKGAHYDSMHRLAAAFSAHWLSLPKSFRCPQAVVREAQRYDTRIQPWEQAAEGSVTWLPASEWRFTALPRPSTILCRMNYPLIEAAIHLIQSGIGCDFLGKNLEEDLTNFFETWRKKTQILVGMFLAIEQAVRQAEEKQDRRAGRMADYLQCLRAISDASACESFDDLDFAIRRLFNTPGPITLATIHKAKGLEWKHVFLLRPDLCPSPKATSEEEIRQEYNMLYVAITRAQESFTYLEPKK